MSTVKLTKLSKEQEALLPVVRDDWLRIGLRTGGDVDRDAARKAIDAVYAQGGLPAPKFLIILNSPFAICLGAMFLRNIAPVRQQVEQQVEQQVRQQVWQQVRQQVWQQVEQQVWQQVEQQVEQQVRQQVWQQVWQQVRQQVEQQVGQQVEQQVEQQVRQQVGQQVEQQVEQQVRQQVGQQVEQQVRQQVGQQVGQQVWQQVRQQVEQQVWQQVEQQVWQQVWPSLMVNQHNAGWFSFYAALLRSGVECCEPMRPLMELAEHGSWWSVWNGAALVAQRADELHRDDENRLHRVDGPAAKWRDGFVVWCWHGVRVPRRVIMEPQSITASEIQAETNAEVRRVMRERYGEGRYLADTGAKLIDADYEGARHGAAPRALLEDNEGRRFLVGTDGSTGRVYHMETVPQAATCRQAHEALCGFSEDRILSKS